MGARACFGAGVTALALVLAGCGAGHDNNSGSGRTLDEYVKEECTLMTDFNDRFQKLLHDYTANSRNQTALADTVDAFGNLYDDMWVKSEKLGDPPNGEGVGGDAEAQAVAKSAVSQFHDIASSIRAAKTDTHLQAAVAKVPDLAQRMVKQGAEMKKKYPTPELDQARKAVPGCSELFGG